MISYVIYLFMFDNVLKGNRTDNHEGQTSDNQARDYLKNTDPQIIVINTLQFCFLA